MDGSWLYCFWNFERPKKHISLSNPLIHGLFGHFFLLGWERTCTRREPLNSLNSLNHGFTMFSNPLHDAWVGNWIPCQRRWSSKCGVTWRLGLGSLVAGSLPRKMSHVILNYDMVIFIPCFFIVFQLRTAPNPQTAGCRGFSSAQKPIPVVSFLYISNTEKNWSLWMFVALENHRWHGDTFCFCFGFGSIWLRRSFSSTGHQRSIQFLSFFTQTQLSWTISVISLVY